MAIAVVLEREESRADFMRLMLNHNHNFSLSSIFAYSQRWPQCISPIVWAVSHLSSHHLFNQHTPGFLQPLCCYWWWEIYMWDFGRLGQYKQAESILTQVRSCINAYLIHSPWSVFTLLLTHAHTRWETPRHKPNPEAVWQHQTLSELWREEIAAPPWPGGMTSEACVAEGCQGLEGKALVVEHRTRRGGMRPAGEG